MQRCALCNARLAVENGRVKCWLGKDHQYYCCCEHAEFSVQKALAALAPFAQTGW